MRLVYFTKSGIKFNPILDNPILDGIADIFLPAKRIHKKHKCKKPSPCVQWLDKKGVMSKYEITNNRHL